MSDKKAYYLGFFKIYEVKVIACEKYLNLSSNIIPSFYNMYLIKFPSGKLKYVKENKIIFEDQKNMNN